MATARDARARLFVPLIGLLAVGGAITMVISLRPGALYVLAAGVALACVGLMAGAFAARRRRPRNEVPAVDQVERWIHAAAGWPDGGRARTLLRRLGDWPHLLDDLSADARARVDRLVTESRTASVLDEWLDPSNPPALRVGAAHVLGWLARPGSEDRLRALLASADSAELAYAAAGALLRVGTPRAYDVLVRELGGQRLPASRVAALLEAADAERLLPVLRAHADSDDSTIRFWVAHLAGFARGDAALTLLLDRTADVDEDVRANAAEALGRLGSDAARPRLEALLADGSWVVQSHAARALGELGPGPSLEPLARLLSSPHWWVRENVVRSLERGGDALIPALRPFLHTVGDGGRPGLVDVLVRLGFGGWADAALGGGAGVGHAPTAAELERDLRTLHEAGAGDAIPGHLRARFALTAPPPALPGPGGAAPARGAGPGAGGEAGAGT